MSVSSLPSQGVLYFDIVSPWAYLMDVALRRDPLPITLELRPVLFAGILNAFGHLGPAEIERKRRFTYEQCTWTAHTLGIKFRMPTVHPFNPLRYLRLILGLGASPTVVSTVFDAIFTTGVNPETHEVWEGLLTQLCTTAETSGINSPTIKQNLRNNTEKAAAAGIFGVPTITIGDRLFWGADSLPMLRAFLEGDPTFDSPAMQAVTAIRFGAKR